MYFPQHVVFKHLHFMLYSKNNAPLNIIDSHFSAEWHSSAGLFSAHGGWWL